MLGTVCVAVPEGYYNPLLPFLEGFLRQSGRTEALGTTVELLVM